MINLKIVEFYVIIKKKRYEHSRARIRSNIRRLLIKYNYPPIKRENAVEQVIKQAELRYQKV